MDNAGFTSSTVAMLLLRLFLGKWIPGKGAKAGKQRLIFSSDAHLGVSKNRV